MDWIQFLNKGYIKMMLHQLQLITSTILLLLLLLLLLSFSLFGFRPKP